MQRCRSDMRKFFRAAAHRPGTSIITLLLAGILVSSIIPGNIYRGWFALAALIFSALFVREYSRRNWRSTFAGRSTMISMVVTVVYTANAVMILWWPFAHWEQYGYPYWEDITEVVYLLLALAALYKLLALWQAGDIMAHDAKRRDSEREPSPPE